MDPLGLRIVWYHFFLSCSFSILLTSREKYMRERERMRSKGERDSFVCAASSKYGWYSQVPNTIHERRREEPKWKRSLSTLSVLSLRASCVHAVLLFFHFSFYKFRIRTSRTYIYVLPSSMCMSEYMCVCIFRRWFLVLALDAQCTARQFSAYHTLHKKRKRERERVKVRENRDTHKKAKRQKYTLAYICIFGF